MSQVIRDLEITPGFNYFGFSAEHQILGAYRDTAGGLFLTVLENTSLSDTEEGLVYRRVYVAFVGEVIHKFNTKDILQKHVIPEIANFRTRVVFVVPGMAKDIHTH